MRGCFVGKIQNGDKSTEQKIFVANGARNALLELPAFETLAIVKKKVDAVEATDLKAKFPGLFIGLGKPQGPDYVIKMKPGAKHSVPPKKKKEKKEKNSPGWNSFPSKSFPT